MCRAAYCCYSIKSKKHYILMNSALRNIQFLKPVNKTDPKNGIFRGLSLNKTTVEISYICRGSFLNRSSLKLDFQGRFTSNGAPCPVRGNFLCEPPF